MTHKVQKEIISGILRPTRRDSPTRRLRPILATQGDRQHERDAGQGYVKFLRDRHHDQQEQVKSKASSVQPNHAAHQASHWFFSTVVMAHLRIVAAPYNLARLYSFRRGMLPSVDSQAVCIITSSDNETTSSTIKP